MITRPHDSPEHWIPAALTMKPRWQLCRDVRSGTAVMRAHPSTYLPKFEAEDPRDWAARVGMTFAYEALGLTIDTLVGLAFTNEPGLGEDVPPRIRLEWENIDGEGTHGSVFAAQCLDSAEQDGHCGILTEFPPVEEGITLAEEQAREIRAYLVRVTIDQIPSWRVMVHGGRRILDQLVIQTMVEQEDGQFGVKHTTQYRVYRQQFDAAGQPFVTWELWETGEKATNLIEGPSVLRGPRFIPFARVFGGQKTGFLESVPPLMGLAYLNIHHTQMASDQAMLMHKAAIPQWTVVGVNDTSDLVVGNNVWFLPTGGDAKVLEITGASLAARREAILDTERRMADQGVAMLQRDNTVEQTATEAQLRETRRESKLARAVRSLQDALEQSFLFMAQYYGLPEGGSLTLRRDFAALTLDEADTALLLKMRENGDLTLATFLGFVAKRPVFETLSPEDEAEAIKAEMGDEPGLTDADVAGTITAA